MLASLIFICLEKPSLDQLYAVTASLKSQALAQGTWRNKDAHFSAFLKFCEHYNLISFPAHRDTLVLYVSFLVYVRGISVGTIRNHLSTIKSYHAEFDVFLPSPSQYLPLRLAIRGAKKYLKRAINQKLPVTPQVLSALLDLVPHTSPLYSFFLVMWLSFCRPSSLIPNSPSLFDPSVHLTWGKIQWMEEGLILDITFSKTLQCQERTHRVSLAASPERPELCPARALVRLMTTPGYPRGLNDPVFAFKQGPNWIPLARSNSYPVFKHLMEVIGVDPSC